MHWSENLRAHCEECWHAQHCCWVWRKKGSNGAISAALRPPDESQSEKGRGKEQVEFDQSPLTRTLNANSLVRSHAAFSDRETIASAVMFSFSNRCNSSCRLERCRERRNALTTREGVSRELDHVNSKASVVGDYNWCVNIYICVCQHPAVSMVAMIRNSQSCVDDKNQGI